MFTLNLPTSLPLISALENTLINVNDCVAAAHELNVLASSILALELGVWLVMESIDVLDHSIGDSQPLG